MIQSIIFILATSVPTQADVDALYRRLAKAELKRDASSVRPFLDKALRYELNAVGGPRSYGLDLYVKINIGNVGQASTWTYFTKLEKSSESSLLVLVQGFGRLSQPSTLRHLQEDRLDSWRKGPRGWVLVKISSVFGYRYTR